VLLPGARRGQQSLDIACSRVAQQKTRRILLQRSTDWTDRQTDGNRTDTYTLLRTVPAVSVINERLAPKDFRSQF